MAAIVAEFVTLVGTLIVFVQDYLVPDTAANITILHAAIWTPVVLGLLGMTVAFLKNMWSKKG